MSHTVTKRLEKQKAAKGDKIPESKSRTPRPNYTDKDEEEDVAIESETEDDASARAASMQEEEEDEDAATDSSTENDYPDTPEHPRPASDPVMRSRSDLSSPDSEDIIMELKAKEAKANATREEEDTKQVSLDGQIIVSSNCKDANLKARRGQKMQEVLIDDTRMEEASTSVDSVSTSKESASNVKPVAKHVTKSSKKGLTEKKAKTSRTVKEISCNLKQKKVEEVDSKLSRRRESTGSIGTRRRVKEEKIKEEEEKKKEKKKTKGEMSKKKKETHVLPDHIDNSMEKEINKVLRSIDKKLLKKGDQVALLLDIFQYFNGPGMDEEKKVGEGEEDNEDHKNDEKSEEEEGKETSRLQQFAMEHSYDGDDDEDLKILINEFQQQLLRSVLEMKSEESNVGLGVEHRTILFKIMIADANDKSPEDRWTRARTLRNYSGVLSDVKLTRVYKDLVTKLHKKIEKNAL